MTRVNSACGLLAFSILVWFCPAYAATDKELLDALDQMYEAPLMGESTLTISYATISLRDCQIYLDKGEFILFKPLFLDSARVRYGGFFTGQGRLLFYPPIGMERQQIGRFFKADSLNRTFTKALILFNDTLYQQLRGSAQVQSVSGGRRSDRLKDGLLDVLQTYKSRYFFFQTLTNLLSGKPQPFLTAAIALDKGGNVVVQCDPTKIEEMGLFKHEWLPGPGHFFQSICSYSLAADPLAGRYNGTYKGGLAPTHYDVDATIWGDGKFTGVVKGTFSVDSIPTQISYLDLSEEMKVDSVLDTAGNPVSFRQYKDGDDYLGFWLVFIRPLQVGEVVPLTFFYAGDVAERELGIYYVFAGSSWYPKSGRHRAGFHMKFHTRSDYQFLCTGRLLSSTTVKDTLVTEWEVPDPEHNVSFNIGFLNKYEFGKEEKTAVDIYFSKDMHTALGSYLAPGFGSIGSHMERQVADDVTGSLRVFSHLFGPYPLDRLAVSEVLQSSSTAYPGSIQLGVATWMSTDQWGYDRLHRSHEVAHQWWGAGVGYESYRDQWLSEGLAEYSSLMYLQAIAGNDQFMDRLDEIRKEVLAERKTAGAIALGIRAANYKEPDHYGILVYEKGALVLHMLRNLFVDLESMNEDRFVNLMKGFYSTYVDKDPSTADFEQLVEKHAGIDMTWFFDQWVYGSDIPTYTFTYKIAPDTGSGKFRADLHVEQADVPDDFRMYVPLEIEYGTGQKQYVRLLIDQPVVDLPLVLPSKPKKLRFNPFLSVLAEVKQ